VAVADLRFSTSAPLGHNHASWTQEPIMDRVSLLHHLHDGARRLCGIVDPHDRLMQVRIKPLAKRCDPPNAKALKCP